MVDLDDGVALGPNEARHDSSKAAGRRLRPDPTA
jgi:hypothetical protein